MNSLSFIPMASEAKGVPFANNSGQKKDSKRVSILAAPVLPQLKITKMLWKIPNPVLRVQQVTATEVTSAK